MSPYAEYALIAVLLVALTSGRVRMAHAFAAFMAGLLLLGTMTSRELLQLLVDPASVAVICLVIFSTLLGRLHWLRKLLVSRRDSTVFAAARRFLGTAGLVSAALPNTAVVGAFMGPAARHPTVPPHQLLMPLSYIALAGGMLTSFGTSASVIVVGQAANRGIGVGVLDFVLPGIAAFAAVLGVLLFFAPLLLSGRRGTAEVRTAELFHIEARVPPGSQLIGKSLIENQLRNLAHFYVAEIVRGTATLAPVHPTELLQDGDVLILAGDVRYIDELRAIAGLQVVREPKSHSSLGVYHAVVSSNSGLVGSTLKEVGFRAAFDASVLGIRRGTQKLSGKLGEIELRPGDLLVISAGSDFLAKEDVRSNFHIVETDESSGAMLSRRDAAIVTALFGSFFVLVTAEIVPFVLAAAMLVFVPLMFGMLTPRELRRIFPFELGMLLWGSIALGNAMTKVGLDVTIAGGVASLLGEAGPLLLILAIFFVTWVLTELLSNVAAGVAALPIGIQLAQLGNLAPEAVVLTVAFGASASFLMPYGYQTHLMVMGPGNYRIIDFLRVGSVVLASYTCAAVLTIWGLASLGIW